MDASGSGKESPTRAIELRLAELEQQNSILLHSMQRAEARADHFAELFSTLPTGVFVLDPTGLVISVNAAGAALLGLDAGALSSRNLQEFFLRQELSAFRRFLDDVFSGPEPVNCELLATEYLPAPRRLLLVGRSHRIKQRCHLSIIDVTETAVARDETNAGERLFLDMFENSRIAIAITRRGVFLHVNRAFADMFLCSDPGLFIGRNALDIVAESHREEMDRRIQAYAMGEPLPLMHAFRGRRMDGSECDCELYLSHYLLKDQEHTLSIVLDVSDRKEAEREVRRLNEELEERVRQRTSDLEAATRELEEFSYTVSHDLRAPIRSIHGLVGMIREDSAHCLGTEERHRLDGISINAQRMGSLIDALLSFTHLGRTHLTVVSIDMDHLIRDVIDDCLDRSSHTVARFTIAPLPALHGDASMMRQLWTHLVDNAIKFSSLANAPVIEITGRELDDECIYTIRDNGVGFDMAFGDKLFGVFQRLHSHDEFSGIGMGLALAQRIVHRHHGHIRAEGSVNGGAIFHVTLPRGAPLPLP